ncbi:MAG: protein arginine kinase [Eubacteriaceae bacterium]|nr:protein arginine kinase [Eubacteriaceae bacterium]
MAWSNEEKDKDIVISSRIRLARNVKNMPFSLLIPDFKAKMIVDMVERCLMKVNQLEKKFTMIQIDSIDKVNRKMLVEKHLTSPELGSNKYAAVFISADDEISIMVNEEDHIRIQCIKEGFQLHSTYELANMVDDVLEECIDFSFHEKFGYLTACPTNVGTGMRASVMLHLPSLTLSDQINTMVVTLGKFGLTIRGLYGEGTQALGDLYQISNQNTLGVTELETINTLHDVSKEIIKKERELRYEILNNNRVYLEDKIYRAYGVLSSARKIDTEESMKLLSLVRLGSDLDIINLDIKVVNGLMTNIQPGILADLYGEDLNTNNSDTLRAEYIRECLKTN